MTKPPRMTDDARFTSAGYIREAHKLNGAMPLAFGEVAEYRRGPLWPRLVWMAVEFMAVALAIVAVLALIGSR